MSIPHPFISSRTWVVLWIKKYQNTQKHIKNWFSWNPLNILAKSKKTEKTKTGKNTLLSPDYLIIKSVCNRFFNCNSMANCCASSLFSFCSKALTIGFWLDEYSPYNVSKETVGDTACRWSGYPLIIRLS